MSYLRNRETQRRLKKLDEGPGKSYFCGVYFDETSGRYKRYYLNDREFKKVAHKKVRRLFNKYLDNTSSKSTYKKIFDYWWIIT